MLRVPVANDFNEVAHSLGSAHHSGWARGSARDALDSHDRSRAHTVNVSRERLASIRSLLSSATWKPLIRRATRQPSAGDPPHSKAARSNPTARPICEHGVIGRLVAEVDRQRRPEPSRFTTDAVSYTHLRAH